MCEIIDAKYITSYNFFIILFEFLTDFEFSLIYLNIVLKNIINIAKYINYYSIVQMNVFPGIDFLVLKV